MIVQNLKEISIGDSQIILPWVNRDPIYANCVKQNITNVKDLLHLYKTGAFVCQNKITKLQLDGVVDLLNYKYCGISSDQITAILAHPLHYASPYILSSLSSHNISRLGLFSSQKRFLSSYIMDILEEDKTISAYNLVHYLEIAYDYIKKERSNTEQQNLLYKLDLLLSMFYSSNTTSAINARIQELERKKKLLIERRKAINEEIVSIDNEIEQSKKMGKF